MINHMNLNIWFKMTLIKFYSIDKCLSSRYYNSCGIKFAKIKIVSIAMAIIMRVVALFIYILNR